MPKCVTERKLHKMQDTEQVSFLVMETCRG